MYLGRVVGLGLLEDGKPFAVYGISGRSEASKAREAKIVKGEIFGGNPDLLLYDAMVLGPERAVVSNGKHGEDIYERLEKRDAKVVITMGKRSGKQFLHIEKQTKKSPQLGLQLGLDSILEEWDAEPDAYRTPRIAGVIEMDETKRFLLGIAAEKGITTVSFSNPKGGKAYLVTTYLGKEGSYDVVSPKGFPETFESFFQLELPGKTPQELADNLYEWLDEKIRVCTAGAVWDGSWKAAVRNG